MTDATPERRSLPRTRGPRDIEVLADERSFPAELSDISQAGLQVRLDAMVFDEIREQIDGVRFGNTPPLAINLRWGIFDGTFGASFTDREMAGPIVDEVIAACEGKLAGQPG